MSCYPEGMNILLLAVAVAASQESARTSPEPEARPEWSFQSEIPAQSPFAAPTASGDLDFPESAVSVPARPQYKEVPRLGLTPSASGAVQVSGETRTGFRLISFTGSRMAGGRAAADAVPAPRVASTVAPAQAAAPAMAVLAQAVSAPQASLSGRAQAIRTHGRGRTFHGFYNRARRQ